MQRRRFEILLKKEASEGVPVYDQLLLTRPDWVVVPTIGAIIPNWLLVIPRNPVLNFRDWITQKNASVEKVLQELTQHLGLEKGEIIWFEHGPNSTKTEIGCGVDHAHIHVLVRPEFDFSYFTELVKVQSDLEWITANSDSAYCGIATEESYMIAGCGDTAIVAHNVESMGSQFFRRVVGLASGDIDGWDYNKYVHHCNIDKTVSTFRQLEGAARRDK